MKRVSYGLTDIGCVRETNQDSFLLHEGEGVYVVADGMGGHAGGEVASSIAVKTIHNVLVGGQDPEETIADATIAGIESYMFERLRYAVNRASQSILQESLVRPGCRGMGTTVVVMMVDGDTVYLGHAGDSRAYLAQREGLYRLTRDHTWVADQIRLGLLTEAQAATSPFRNLLTRSVGFDAHIELDTASRRIESGDRFLMCSDGLHGVVPDPEIHRILLSSSPQLAAERLVAAARERGGPDNITALIVAFDDVPQPVVHNRRPRSLVNLDE